MHYNYSQEIISAVPCGAQFYYIRLAPHAASPDIFLANRKFKCGMQSAWKV